MNRLENDRKEPGETWAHYIVREVGEGNFDVLYRFEDVHTPSITSSFVKSGVYFDVAEYMGKEQEGVATFKEVMPSTHILIGRSRRSDDEPEITASIHIYPDNNIEINDYDPRKIPPDAKASIECYRKEEDVQEFADSLIGFAKGLLTRRRI